ncbi:MAG: hypothetical protein AAGC84_10700 [Pseudomonas sp.]
MPPSLPPQVELTNQQLAGLYLEALNDIDPGLLGGHTVPNKHGYSGLYLPAIPDGYWQAKTRVMVIGRETRGWNVVKQDQVCTDLATYIACCMATQKKFQAEYIGKSADAKATFYNLPRMVAKRCGTNAVAIGNLFCIAHKKTIPTGSKDYAHILQYSEALLKLQLKAFRPHIVIFANGTSSVKQRRAFFPIDGQNQVCFNGRHFLQDGIDKNHLWAFEMDGMQCYRIHHPSSRHREKAEAARRFLMTLLPEHAPLP